MMQNKKLTHSPSPQERRRESKSLASFLRSRASKRSRITKLLRTRTFVGDEDASEAKRFLNDAGAYLRSFEQEKDLSTRSEFLQSLMTAWEWADAAGCFNRGTLSSYSQINRFSRTCLNQVIDVEVKRRSSESEKRYLQEMARIGIIHVVELYRAQKLKDCRQYLNRLLTFARSTLRNKDLPCDGLLGQLYYLSSKVNRNDGRLNDAETELAQAAKHYSARALRLAAHAKALERNNDERLREELDDVRSMLNEERLGTGAVELSRAWLYFSQCNYKAAKHSAHAALLLLAPAKDGLAHYHAKLIAAAVQRVTATSAFELDAVVTELTEIRQYFDKRRHFRLRARTEYELLLALILLDSTLEAPSDSIKNDDPLKDAKKYLKRTSNPPSSRWVSLKLTLHSRFLRHCEMKKEVTIRDFAPAIEMANWAFDEADKTDNQSCRMEALIASGEAYFEEAAARQVIGSLENGDATPTIAGNSSKGAESFNSAKRILSSALDISANANFPELTAIAHLLLARIAVWSGYYNEADYHLYRFRRLAVPEHVWIQRLHSRVFSEYRRDDQLILREDQLTKSEAYRALHKYLIGKAEEKAKKENGKVTEDAVAFNIGVTRTTLTNWRRETLNRPRFKKKQRLPREK